MAGIILDQSGKAFSEARQFQRDGGRSWLRNLRREAIAQNFELRRDVIDRIRSELGFRSKYPAADTANHYANWTVDGGSADEDTLDDLPALRARTRDLIRSDPLASGLWKTWVDGVVGKGLVPQSRLDRESIGITERQAKRFEQGAERSWQLWSRRCDSASRMSHRAMQRLWLKSFFESGDVFKLGRPFNRQSEVRYSLQTIEADRVDNPYLGSGARDNDRMGVRVNPDTGEHSGYWIKRTHPGDRRSNSALQDDWRFVRKRNKAGDIAVHHLLRIERPDQTRGIPLVSAALDWFQDLRQMFKAELWASKVASCFALFRTIPDDPTAAAKANQTDTDRRIEDLDFGIMEYLSPGEDVKAFQLNRPGTTWDSFVLRSQRVCGSSIQMPYEEFTQDFSKTTYTSGRMALLAARRMYDGYQDWFAEDFCTPDWERVIEEGVLRGLIEAPRFEENRDEYLKVMWIGPKRDWVDPQKDGKALIELNKANLITKREIITSRGGDYEEHVEQLRREKEEEEEAGIRQEAPEQSVNEETSDADEEETQDE